MISPTKLSIASTPSRRTDTSINTQAPSRPTFVLDPASITGPAGSNTTAINPATYNGTAAAGSTITIKDGTTVIDTFTLNSR